jgi:peroxin-14
MVQKYLFPHLKPPTLTAYEADKEALTAQFDAAEQLLKEIQSETQVMKTNIEEQRAKVEAAVQDVTTAVEEMRKGEEEVRDEMREIRTEVNNMQEMLPKVRNLHLYTNLELKPHAQMLDRVRDQERVSYGELQTELKSLKALLLSSRDSTASTGPPAILSQLGRRPSIPTWQLAQNASSSTPVIPTPNILDTAEKDGHVATNSNTGQP